MMLLVDVLVFREDGGDSRHVGKCPEKKFYDTGLKTICFHHLQKAQKEITNEAQQRPRWQLLFYCRR